jgi:hypothetical protein
MGCLSVKAFQPVVVGSHIHESVPEAIRNGFRIDLAANQDRGVRVSQAVQVKGWGRQLPFEFWTLEAQSSKKKGTVILGLMNPSFSEVLCAVSSGGWATF